MTSPKNLDIHIKVLKQLRNRQKRKIQQLLETKSERKQNSDRISEISYGANSTCERSYLRDDSIGSTKSEFRIQTKKGCLKQSSKFENLMIESDKGDFNSGSYSSLRKYEIHNNIDISKLVQDEKLTVSEITCSSTPKNQQIRLGLFPPISCTVLPRIESSDDSLPAIQDKYKHEYLSPLSFKNDDCRQKLSTFASKQRLKYQGHQYQHSYLNESSDAIVKRPYKQMTKNYGIILRNDLSVSSSRNNGSNLELTSYQEIDRNKGAINDCNSDDEMFYKCEDIVEISNDDCGQQAANNCLINTQALPQIFPVVVRNRKRTELKKKINFESTTNQLENLKKLQTKLKINKESEPQIKCVKLNPKLLKNKSNEQSTKMSIKEIKQEIEATTPSPQKIKVPNIRSFGIMKKSY